MRYDIFVLIKVYQKPSLTINKAISKKNLSQKSEMYCFFRDRVIVNAVIFSKIKKASKLLFSILVHTFR